MLRDNLFTGFEGGYESSLKKHGLICRNEKSDQYLCFYSIAEGLYDYSFLNESDLDDIVNLKSWVKQNVLDEFLKFCNLSKDNFLKLPFMTKLHNMMQFFGKKDIMGTPTNSLTLKEVMDMIENE